MKESIIDYVLANGIWDSSDSDCPAIESFKEWDEDEKWFVFNRSELRRMVREGIYYDECAAGALITRIVSREWIRTESKTYYPEDDIEYEIENAGKIGSNWQLLAEE